jgi:ribonucleoside-diphosphate reductase alpha chain
VTTIAPTGTLSVIAGCSSGIEPLFAVAYVRHALDGAELREEHPLLAGRLTGPAGAAALAAIRSSGRARGVPGVPAEVERLFATAHDVSPEAHVRMQAAFQRHVDNGVSKTINLPAGATVEAVERAFLLAHELGLKGITVYRDGSREGQVLTTGLPGTECPACGATLSRSGGCMTCRSCGYGTCETTE